MTLTYFDGFTRIGSAPGQHGSERWRLDQLVEEMHHCSISAALVTSTAQIHYDSMLENRRLVDQLADYDYLFPIWNVLPHWTGECPEPAKLLQLMQDHNVRAVTLYSQEQHWPILSHTSEPLLRELERTRTLTILDGLKLDWAPLEALLGRFPDLPILLRGVVWTRQREILPLMMSHRNLHVGFDRFQVNRGLEWLCERGCEDQVVFCSNGPEMSMGAHRAYIDWSDLPRAIKAKAAAGNLTRLLKGLAPPREIENHEEDELMAEARRGEPLSCLVLDCHSHILDEGLQGCGMMPQFQGGPSGLLEMAGRMGVDGIGVMSWNGAVTAQFVAGNQCVKDALDAMPDTCWGLGTFDVMHESADEQWRAMEAIYADPRFLGLKSDPNFGRDYDHPDFEVWWRFGQQRGLYALLHPSYGRTDLSEFDVLCPKYPAIKFLAAHCGANYKRADSAIEIARKHPNFIAELTYTSCLGGLIDYLVEAIGPERVVYGTDQPMRDPRQQMGCFIYSRLGVEQKKMLIGENTNRLITPIRQRQRKAGGRLRQTA